MKGFHGDAAPSCESWLQLDSVTSRFFTNWGEQWVETKLRGLLGEEPFALTVSQSLKTKGSLVGLSYLIEHSFSRAYPLMPVASSLGSQDHGTAFDRRNIGFIKELSTLFRGTIARTFDSEALGYISGAVISDAVGEFVAEVVASLEKPTLENLYVEIPANAHLTRSLISKVNEELSQRSVLVNRSKEEVNAAPFALYSDTVIVTGGRPVLVVRGPLFGIYVTLELWGPGIFANETITLRNENLGPAARILNAEGVSGASAIPDLLAEAISPFVSEYAGDFFTGQVLASEFSERIHAWATACYKAQLAVAKNVLTRSQYEESYRASLESLNKSLNETYRTLVR